ncbi:MAG: 1-phosphofructokinase family hexose kinase [Oscillospiraceae bacterium]|nr:1-phosphofructokinase family hexose kinase [Oscillospiraceae bacterium]
MIYTLTMNPAIDYVVTVPDLLKGRVNRGESRGFSAAGKGLNVSLALKRLGVESYALCTCGEIEREKGNLTETFLQLLQSSGIRSGLFNIKGSDTRINVKVHSGGEVTEINGDFYVPEEDSADIAETIIRMVKKGDFFIIGGSLPNGIPCDFYANLTENLAEKGAKVFVDTSGEPLRRVIQTGKAFLVKPNRHELAELFGLNSEAISTPEDAVTYGAKLGCNALVSLGEAGAVFVNGNDGEEYVYAAENKIKNAYTVGAGDALLAGFVETFIKTTDYETSLKSAVKFAESSLVLKS